MLPSRKISRTSSGFTLLEILIVITIVGIMAGVLIMVINPNRSLGRSRNTRRRIDLHAITLALKTYQIQKGDLPPQVTTTPTEICRQNAADCTGLVDLSVLLQNEEFLVSLPADPESVSLNGTGYFISRSTFGAVTATAPLAEIGETISVVK